jgi:hypothetical protein
MALANRLYIKLTAEEANVFFSIYTFVEMSRRFSDVRNLPEAQRPDSFAVRPAPLAPLASLASSPATPRALAPQTEDNLLKAFLVLVVVNTVGYILLAWYIGFFRGVLR